MPSTHVYDFELPTLPGAQARDALLKLAEIFGEQETFAFLGLMHGNDSPVGEVRAILAGRRILDAMNDQVDLTYHQARLQVGKYFGYAGTGLSNWNKIADRGRDILIEAGQWKADRR